MDTTKLPDSAFRQMVLSIPQMVWTATSSGELEYVNPRTLEYTGVDRADLKAQGWKLLLHPEDYPGVDEAWKRAIAAQSMLEVSCRLRSREEGAYCWYIVRAVPDIANGEIRWFGTCTEIEDQKRAEEALRFLATTSDILASKRDSREAMRQIAEKSIESIADICIIDLESEEFQIERLIIAYPEGSDVKSLEQFLIDYTAKVDDEVGAGAVMRTGQSEFYPTITDELLKKRARDSTHLEVLRKLAMRSVIVVPIRIQDKQFGAVIFIRTQSHKHYSESELTFAEEVARRVGATLENSYFTTKSQRTAELYSRMFQTDLLGVIITDKEGHIFEANDTFLQMIGYSRSDLEQGLLTRQGLTPHSHLHVYPEVVRQLEKTGSVRPYEKKYIRRDGAHIDVLVGTTILEGVSEQVMSFVLDITAKKTAESIRRESEERFRTLAVTATDAIVTIDSKSNVRFANPSTKVIFGYAPEELIGQKLTLLMPEYLRQLHHAGIDRYLVTGHRKLNWSSIELTGLHKDGHEVPIEVSFGEYFEGGRHYFNGIIRDITARKQAEAALRSAKEEAERAGRTKDEFLAILSHELRTPLTPAVTALHAVLNEEVISQDVRQWIEIAERNITLESRLIDDLLDITRVATGKLSLDRQPIDLHEVIRLVIQMSSPELTAKDINLTTELNAKNSIIFVDLARMQQVLWNLIRNAVKFTLTGGEIKIVTRNFNHHIAVDVIDNGIGIEAELLPNIFRAFEQGRRTRSYGGLGLGLAITQSLIEIHDGTIQAFSGGENKGAKFTVALPTYDGVVTEVKVDDAKQEPVRTRDARILIIDDHPDSILVLQSVLERHGYEVGVATTGAEGLARLHESTYHLILSDIGLPDMTGWKFLGEARKLQDIPAVALSGFGSEEDLRKSAEAGFHQHITKPFNMNELFVVIHDLLEGAAES